MTAGDGLLEALPADCRGKELSWDGLGDCRIRGAYQRNDANIKTLRISVDDLKVEPGAGFKLRLILENPTAEALELIFGRNCVPEVKLYSENKRLVSTFPALAGACLVDHDRGGFVRVVLEPKARLVREIHASAKRRSGDIVENVDNAEPLSPGNYQAEVWLPNFELRTTFKLTIDSD